MIDTVAENMNQRPIQLFNDFFIKGRIVTVYA